VKQPLDEKLPSYDVPLHVKSLLVEATPILQLRNMVCSNSFIEPFGIHHKRERSSNFVTLKEIKRIDIFVICYEEHLRYFSFWKGMCIFF
jgi:hypothetical protein